MTPLIELAAPRVMKRRAAMQSRIDSVPRAIKRRAAMNMHTCNMHMQSIHTRTRLYLNSRRLRELRSGLGMTQLQLGETSGISNSRICCYERKDVCVHILTANALAAALGVTVGEIARQTEEL